MGAPNILNEQSLYRFLEEHGDNQVKRRLLFFWGSHPNAEFARNAIGYALDFSKLELDKALRVLVEAGLVDTHIHNDMTFYSLTTNNENRQPVLALAALGWDQWQLMLKRMEEKDKLTKYQYVSGGSLKMRFNLASKNGAKNTGS